MEIDDIKFIPTDDLSPRQKEYFWSLYFKSFPLSIWYKKEFERVFLSGKGAPAFIARKGSRYAGFILGRKMGGDTLISLFFVFPAFRNKGLATSLMKKFLGESRKRKETDSILVNFREQKKLEEFYKKLGFSNFHIIGTYRNGDKKCQMELILK